MIIERIFFFIIGIFLMYFGVYEEKCKKMEAKISQLWIKIDDNVKNYNSWFLRSYQMVTKIIKFLWGEKIFSFKSFGVSMFFSWFCFLISTLYMYALFFWQKSWDVGMGYFIPFIEKINIQTCGMNTIGLSNKTAIIHFIIIAMVLVWFITLCFMPKVFSKKIWIPMWIVTCGAVFIWVWPNMCEHHTTIYLENNKPWKKVINITEYTPQIKIIMCFIIFILPNLLLSFFMYDYNKLLKSKNVEVVVQASLILRILVYLFSLFSIILILNLNFDFKNPFLCGAIKSSFSIFSHISIGPIIFILIMTIFLYPLFLLIRLIMSIFNFFIYALLQHGFIHEQKKILFLGLILACYALFGKAPINTLMQWLQ